MYKKGLTLNLVMQILPAGIIRSNENRQGELAMLKRVYDINSRLSLL